MQEEQNNNQVDRLSDNNSRALGIDYHYNQRPPLSRGQKIAVAVLAFFSFFVIVLWLIQFKQSIANPMDKTKTASDSVVGDSANEETVDVVKDTDGDGLTDYNELNTYKTSPYLEDSDSDGFSDKVEVDSEKDPNCPTGQTCKAVVVDEATADQTVTNTPLSDTTIPTTGAGNEQTGGSQTAPALTAPTTANTADLQKVLSGQVDVATLRQMLLASGMDAVTLGKISDEALMASYKETLAK